MKENILYNVSVCHFWKHNTLKSISVAIGFSTVFNGEIQATQCTETIWLLITHPSHSHIPGQKVARWQGGTWADPNLRLLQKWKAKSQGRLHFS